MTEKSRMHKVSAPRKIISGLLLVALSLFLGEFAQAQTPALAPLQAPAVYNHAANANSAIPDDVVMGDFNGDGYLDFAVVEFPFGTGTTGQLEIFFGNKDGSFTSQGFVPIGAISGQPYATNHNIAVGHFNGATQGLDIAVAVTQAPGCATGGVVILYGDGKGNFQSPVCLANPTPVISVAVADFNLDGYDDIAVSNANGSVLGSITVYWNNASVSSLNNQSGFSTTRSASALLGTTTQVLYGKIVIGNIPGQYAPSIAILANTGPFTQAASFFVTLYEEQNGIFFVNFVPPTLALVPSGNGFSDIALGNITSTGINALIGIGVTTGITYAPLTGIPVPVIGAQQHLSTGDNGLAFAMADFDGNGTSDFAYLDASQNLNISLNPGNTNATKIGPFGPVGQGVAAGLSTGLGKWVIVDSGQYQQTTPSFVAYPAARSIAVYLVDPTTGQPAIAPLYSQSSYYTSGTQRAFAVGDFDGDGSPDVAVLGEDPATFNATVTISHNDYKTTTPGYNASPTVVDLGTLLGLGGGSIGYGGSTGYALAAGSFRTIDPDIAMVTAQGVTLLQNQTTGPGQPFNFVLDTNCAGYTGAAINNCYLANDSHFPGISTSSSPRPPIIAADMNGDGYQDIVVAFPQNCVTSTQSAIYVLLSNGDGTFQTPIYIPSPVVNPIGLAVGKILGGSVPDLVVINGGESCSGTLAATGAPTFVGAALIPNNGGGIFGTPQTIYAQSSDVAVPSVSSVAIADMNADGAPDVVLSAKDGIHVLLNSPTTRGAFTDLGAVPLYAPIDTIVNTSQIDIADLNLDGKLDVAAAVDGIVYVFPGDGTGNLSIPAQGFASGPNSNQLKAIDVNGDTVPDVLVNNSAGFSVLLNGSAPGAALPLAQFELSPTLNYGGIAEGSSAVQQVILFNTGGGTLQVANIAFANNTGNEYAFAYITPPCVSPAVQNSVTSLSIPAGGSCTINITFTPNTIGTANAQLLFYDNAPTSNAPNVLGSTANSYVQTVTLNATGIQGSANVSIGVASSPAVVAVGVPITYTITLTNSGPNAATNLTFLHTLESFVQLQSVTSSQGSCTGTPTLGAAVSCALGTLAANSSATITLVATPALALPTSNSFAITQDEANTNPETAYDNINVLTSLVVTIPTINETILVSDAPTFSDLAVPENIVVSDQVFVTPVLSSFGPPAAAFSNSSLGFGNTVGTVQTLTLSSVGGSPLVLVGSPLISAGFQVGAPVCSATGSSGLPSGGQCAYAITYTGGATAGTIVFTDNAALSNPPSTQSGLNFAQTIQLSAAGTSSTPIGLPSTVVTIPTISESIQVTDLVSTSGISVPETINVTDTVSVAVLQSITVTPSNHTISEGGHLAYTAMGNFSDGSARNLTAAATWSSAAPNLASMNGNVATGIAYGGTTITAQLGNTSGSTTLTVFSYLTITPKLKTITRDSKGDYIVTLSVTNTGDATANKVAPIFSILGSKIVTSCASTNCTPATNLGPGATGTVTLLFPATAGRQLSRQRFTILGTATGTNPNGSAVLPAVWALSTTVTLP